MGGGVSTLSTQFSIERKRKLANSMIERASDEIGIDLTKFPNRAEPTIRVLTEKQWKARGNEERVAAQYRSDKNEIEIRRQFFAGLKVDDLIHEILHTRSGPRNRGTEKNHLGRILEEGSVQLLTERILDSARTKRGRFARRTEIVYRSETADIKALEKIVGANKMLEFWREGYKNSSFKLANELRKKGFHKTANRIDRYNNPNPSNRRLNFDEDNIRDVLKKD